MHEPRHEDGGPAPASSPALAAEPPIAAIYTCPMHPQIRRGEPGHCPLCGMTLERVQPAREAGQSLELRDMTRRFWVGAALAAPVVLLDMTTEIHALAVHRVVAPVLSLWI